MAIFLEPAQFLIGLQLARSGNSWGPFEHYVQRTQPEGARSGPGDLDLVAYSLRKWLRLAISGNPTVLLLLFSHVESLVVRSEAQGFANSLLPSSRGGQGRASSATCVRRRSGWSGLGASVA